MKLSTVISFIFSILILTCSSNALAATNEELAKKCLDVGKAKISEQAELYRCKIDINQIEVREIDDHSNRPYINIWYQVATDCAGSDRLINLVQFYKNECF